MVYLLDTCILIKAIAEPEKINKNILDKLLDKHNQLFVSASSIWEITIKHNKHPDLVPFSGRDILEKLEQSDTPIIPIDKECIANLEEVYKIMLHNDPFDHMLLATAKAKSLILITEDKLLAKYNYCDVLLAN